MIPNPITVDVDYSRLERRVAHLPTLPGTYPGFVLVDEFYLGPDPIQFMAIDFGCRYIGHPDQLRPVLNEVPHWVNRHKRPKAVRRAKRKAQRHARRAQRRK